jgi:hypothetical protein
MTLHIKPFKSVDTIRGHSTLDTKKWRLTAPLLPMLLFVATHPLHQGGGCLAGVDPLAAWPLLGPFWASHLRMAPSTWARGVPYRSRELLITRSRCCVAYRGVRGGSERA